MPKFDLPNMEMPEAFREMAEKGVEQTRDTYAKAKVASEEAADLLKIPTRPLPSGHRLQSQAYRDCPHQHARRL